jgi:ADP-ribosylglycohydrolase
LILLLLLVLIPALCNNLKVFLMNKCILGSVTAAIILGTFSTATMADNSPLQAVNDELQRRVVVLRDQHHIIVSQADEDNIRQMIIVERLRTDDSDGSVREKFDAAIATYEVNSPNAQQDIYIQYAFGGGDGAAPPK